MCITWCGAFTRSWASCVGFFLRAKSRFERFTREVLQKLTLCDTLQENHLGLCTALGIRGDPRGDVNAQTSKHPNTQTSKHPNTHTPIHPRSGTFWDALGRSGSLWDALGRSGALWDALGRSRTLWEALGSSGML